MSKIKVLALLLLLLALGLFIKPLYYYGKALLAQQLLQNAWQQSQQQLGQESIPPWFWADTYPVAKLSYLPQANNAEQNKAIKASWIILAGLSGRTMAFAPAWLQDSAKPNEYGNTVISAHNDSHFKVFEQIKSGDLLLLENRFGKVKTYQVNNLEIVQETNSDAYQFSEKTLLTLITCYPFTITENNKTLRLVIQAEAISES